MDQDPVTGVTITVSAGQELLAVTLGTGDCDLTHTGENLGFAGFKGTFEAY